MAPLIRPYDAPDHDAVAEQFLALNRFEEPLARNRRIDLEGATLCLRAALSAVSKTSGSALVAEVDGAVVGHLFLIFERDAVFVREPLRPYAYVSELFVREAFRRHGIGRALMTEAERIAQTSGVPRLMVGVLAGNDAAARLYAGLGFSPHAVEFEKRLVDQPGADPEASQ